MCPAPRASVSHRSPSTTRRRYAARIKKRHCVRDDEREMFSKLTDRPVAPRDLSPRETNSEVNENGKRRWSESTDDRREHDFHRHASRSQLSSPNGVFREHVAMAPLRVLTTRYPLTTTGYKYITIGVTIKSPWYGIPSPSYVDIALGDKQGKEICLTLDMWKGLVERKRDIVESLRSSLVDGTRSPSPISIGDLTLRFGLINNLPILRMEIPNEARLVISLTTVLSLYDLQFCVDRVVSALSAATEEVDAKHARYREIAHNARKTGTSIKNAIRKSEYFDPGNIVDCEIAALCFTSDDAHIDR